MRCSSLRFDERKTREKERKKDYVDNDDVIDKAMRNTRI